MRSRQTQQNHPRIDKANWCNDVHWCGIQAIPFGLSMSIWDLKWFKYNLALHHITPCSMLSAPPSQPNVVLPQVERVLRNVAQPSKSLSINRVVDMDIVDRAQSASVFQRIIAFNVRWFYKSIVLAEWMPLCKLGRAASSLKCLSVFKWFFLCKNSPTILRFAKKSPCLPHPITATHAVPFRRPQQDLQLASSLVALRLPRGAHRWSRQRRSHRFRRCMRDSCKGSRTSKWWEKWENMGKTTENPMTTTEQKADENGKSHKCSHHKNGVWFFPCSKVAPRVTSTFQRE